MATKFSVHSNKTSATGKTTVLSVAHEAITYDSASSASTKIRVARNVQRMTIPISFLADDGETVVMTVEKVVGEEFGDIPAYPTDTPNRRLYAWLDSTDSPITEKTIVTDKVSRLTAQFSVAEMLTLDYGYGSGATQSVVVYNGFAIGDLPEATGPVESPAFFGWTKPNGDFVNASTVYDGSYTTLSASYGEWGSSIDVTISGSYTKAGIYSSTALNTGTKTLVDWGDGNKNVVNGNISQLTHEYSSPGAYVIRVSDTVSSLGLSANSSAWYQTTTNNRYVVTSVSLSNRITYLPSYQFYYLQGLTSYSLPSGITSVPSYCFSYCTSLTTIELPAGISAIGSYAFSFCSFVSFTVPSSVKYIQSGTFYYCQKLETIALHDSIVEIQSSAFYYCSSLKTVSLPASLKTIGTYAFYYCRSSSFNTIVIPDSVTSLGAYAFQGCYYVKSITIGSGVTAIPSNCFYYCFYNSSSAGSIVIPEGIKSIGSGAFRGCYYLSSVDVPSTVTSLGSYAFAGCTRLAEITIRSASVPSLSSSTYIFGSSASQGSYSGYTGYVYRANGTNKIKVPADSLEAYDTALRGNTYAAYLLDSTKCGFTLEAI